MDEKNRLRIPTWPMRERLATKTPLNCRGKEDSSDFLGFSCPNPSRSGKLLAAICETPVTIPKRRGGSPDLGFIKGKHEVEIHCERLIRPRRRCLPPRHVRSTDPFKRARVDEELHEEPWLDESQDSSYSDDVGEGQEDSEDDVMLLSSSDSLPTSEPASAPMKECRVLVRRLTEPEIEKHINKNRSLVDFNWAEGNKMFRRENFSKAVAYYSLAITLDPTNPSLFINRATALYKCRKFCDSYVDAIKCLDLGEVHFKEILKVEPCLCKLRLERDTLAKGYLIKGLSELELGLRQEAMLTFSQGLKNHPSDENLKKGKRRAMEVLGLSCIVIS